VKTIAVNINPQYHKTKAQINSEHKLVEAAKKDKEKFRAIYNTYYEIVFRFIYQRTGDETTTSDIVSEVFYKALENLTKYEFRGLPFSSWLLRIAHNETIKYYRKISKARVVKLETKHLQNLTSEESDNHIDELKPLLLNALKELKIEDLQLIEMRFFEGRPFKEMAEILNKKESAVKMRVYRILAKLKCYFKKNKND
tara:strand:- start:2154 stop:2747 length:594 start_codon:yes stop_codon:yes gene_type:complete